MITQENIPNGNFHEEIDAQKHIVTDREYLGLHSTFMANSAADAREWARHFVHWHNFKHRHSGIRYVSPAQRHAGQDRDILAQRHALYLQTRERNPSRWSRQTRNWNPIEVVALNPERDAAVSMAVQSASDKKVAAA